MQSPVVEFVIDQDAIDEPADREKIVHQIVVDDFIPQRNWAADGTPANKSSDHKSHDDGSDTMDDFLDQLTEDHLNGGYQLHNG